MNGWKEIANHLGKDVKTAQRWETAGHSPVYRDGVKVFAYADQLDQWQKDRIVGPSPEATQNPADGQERSAVQLPAIKVNAIFAVAAVIVTLWGIWRSHQLPALKEARPRRLLAGATSEDHSPHRLETGQTYSKLLMAPDAKILYAISSPEGRSIAVIGVEDLQIKRTFRLPLPPRTAFLSRNGKHIYIPSLENGVMVMDRSTYRGVPELIPTGGPAYDVAVTPDEKKLFLAMG